MNTSCLEGIPEEKPRRTNLWDASHLVTGELLVSNSDLAFPANFRAFFQSFDYQLFIMCSLLK